VAGGLAAVCLINSLVNKIYYTSIGTSNPMIGTIIQLLFGGLRQNVSFSPWPFKKRIAFFNKKEYAIFLLLV